MYETYVYAFEKYVLGISYILIFSFLFVFLNWYLVSMAIYGIMRRQWEVF